MNVRGVGKSAVSSSAVRDPFLSSELERRADVETLGAPKKAPGVSAHPHALTWRQVLDFEAVTAELRLSRPLKARFVREDFGCSLTRYYAALVNAIAQPDAAIYAPVLVARLRRLRDRRRLARTAASSPPVLRRDPRQRPLELSA